MTHDANFLAKLMQYEVFDMHLKMHATDLHL